MRKWYGRTGSYDFQESTIGYGGGGGIPWTHGGAVFILARREGRGEALMLVESVEYLHSALSDYRGCAVENNVNRIYWLEEADPEKRRYIKHDLIAEHGRPPCNR